MFSVPKKLLSLFFVLTLAWFQLTTPALASTYSVDLGNGNSSTLVGALAGLQLATPALASIYSVDLGNGNSSILVADASINYQSQSSEGFVSKCLFSQPDSGVGEIACNVAKGVIPPLVYLGVCYATDAIATNIFPPAIALAPLCNILTSGAINFAMVIN